MNRQIIITSDGSHSLFVPQLNESYHSKHGAITESQHVYIQAGLLPLIGQYPIIHVLEIGFGTGLNTWLTLQQAIQTGAQIVYHAIEPYPLTMEEATLLNYASSSVEKDLFMQLHQAAWEQLVVIHPQFSLYKQKSKLDSNLLLREEDRFHLVYFDAFAPDVQPTLWTEQVFSALALHMYTGGVLVTYSSKSIVRRAMQAAGWSIEKLSGPPGKREIIRARKAM